MTLQLLIVDDEPLARLRLRTLVADVQASAAPGAGAAWVVAGEAASADEALRLLNQHTVHALLLDIQMPGRSGLQLAQALRAMAEPPAVVFVTAHDEHALQAFELHAVDYLTKPVRRERLAEALQRLADRVQSRLPAPGAGSAADPVPLVAGAAAAAPPAARNAAAAVLAAGAAAAAVLAANTAAAVVLAANTAAAVLVIHQRDRLLRLPVADLLYFRADHKQVLLRTADASYLIDESLAELEDRLAALGGAFIRVHRNALVALSAMRELELRQEAFATRPDTSEGWAVRVAPLDEWLSVSRRQVAAVKAALGAGPG